MDKLHEENRKQFECWRRKFIGVLVNLDRDHKTGNYVCIGTWTAWEAWQASRAGIVVELPRPSCVYADHSYPAYSQKQVEDLLSSIGLSIKGE